jgi:hypothetical protein
MLANIIYLAYLYTMGMIKTNIAEAAQNYNVSVAEMTKLIQQKQVPYQFANAKLGLLKIDYNNIRQINSYTEFKQDILVRVGNVARGIVQPIIDFGSPYFHNFIWCSYGLFLPCTYSIYILLEGSNIVYFGRTTDGERRKEQHIDLGKIFDTMLFIPVPDCLDLGSNKAANLELEGRLIKGMQTKYNNCIIARNARKNAAWENKYQL